MNAIQVSAPGSADALQYADVPRPTPKEGEVLVRIEAIGVNYIDVYHRSGLYPMPLPSGIGMEGAGTVTAVGPDETLVKVGARGFS